MKTWAILPVKPFVRAKSRLVSTLSAEQRRAMAERMFRHSIEILSTVQEVAGVIVLSRDSKALAIAREYGVRTMQESGPSNLNTSLHRASKIMRSEILGGVLILPADLPLVNPEDIEQIIYMGRYHMTVVIAPDRNEDGTNGILVKPPGLIPFSFGPGSFQRHTEIAQTAGATVQIYRSARIGLDIDTPDDLDFYRQLVTERAYNELISEASVLPLNKKMIASV